MKPWVRPFYNRFGLLESCQISPEALELCHNMYNKDHVPLETLIARLIRWRVITVRVSSLRWPKFDKFGRQL